MPTVSLIVARQSIALHHERERHKRIKEDLRLAGSSLAQVARELGVQPTTVTSVSQGYRRSRRIEGLIATKLSTTPAGLWPDRYITRSPSLSQINQTGDVSPETVSH